MVIQNPSATYSYTIGTGGEGGAHTGYIPDTVDELRAAMENEHPDTEYTDNELQSMINTYENSGWTGSPNPWFCWTASTFGSYSSADGVAQTVYEPITDQFFAVNGYAGIRGGKGGLERRTYGRNQGMAPNGHLRHRPDAVEDGSAYEEFDQATDLPM